MITAQCQFLKPPLKMKLSRTLVRLGVVRTNAEAVQSFSYSQGRRCDPKSRGFIYPVVTHWVWSDGWLAKGGDYTIDNKTVTVGYQDFAGSGVVHVVGGVAAFVGALLVGPRIGRFHADTKTVVGIRGHSVPFAALGGFILLFGFLAFNGGSVLSISGENNGATVSLAVVNTIISASVSAFFTLLLQKTGLFGNSRWSLLTTLNGALAGMITSWYVLKLKVDDPLDAVAVHFGGGTWGVIAVAFLNRDTGILLHWNQESGLKLGWQLCGLAAIIAWTGVLSLLLFGVMKLLRILRVPEDIERKGLDIPKHGEPAYPLESYGHGHIERVMRILESGQLQYIMQGYVPAQEEGGSEAVVQSGYESPEVNVLKNRNGNTVLPVATTPL
ncbi:hypothetical protein BaRGS_00020875 [Batillaria attramentaria]|uniref:Ammonium transporter AmtB-like domain-containing protein n=1 Tax=Batillaria attramentaria TaxID=370345 RepID=A0ABD0KLB8_9CAEN